MASSIDQLVADMLADGRMTLEEADVIQTFGRFLRELPPNKTFASQVELDAFKARWLPYMRGEADGPIKPQGGGQDG